MNVYLSRGYRGTENKKFKQRVSSRIYRDGIKILLIELGSVEITYRLNLLPSMPNSVSYIDSVLWDSINQLNPLLSPSNHIGSVSTRELFKISRYATHLTDSLMS